MHERDQCRGAPHGLLEAHIGQAADAQKRQMVDVEFDVDNRVYAAFCSTCDTLGLFPEEVVRQGLT